MWLFQWCLIGCFQIVWQVSAASCGRCGPAKASASASSGIESTTSCLPRPVWNISLFLSITLSSSFCPCEREVLEGVYVTSLFDLFWCTYIISFPALKSAATTLDGSSSKFYVLATRLKHRSRRARHSILNMEPSEKCQLRCFASVQLNSAV